MTMNFNTAKTQKNFEPVPDGVYLLHVTINPGGAGPDGWLKESKDGLSLGLDCEFTVVDGEYANRKIFARFTISGTTDGHKTAAEISGQTLRAVLESARGIRPDDTSDAACQARSIASYEDLSDLRILARIGTQPAKGGYEAKNVLRYIITPGMKDWRAVEQIKAPSAAPVNAYAAASAARTHEPPPPPAAVQKPSWAN